MALNVLSRFADALARFQTPSKNKPTAKETAVMTGPLDGASDWGMTNPDEIIDTKGLSIIDEMRLDDALGAYVDIKKTARLATGWQIIPASDEAEDVKRAEFVDDMFDRMEGSLKSALRDIMSAMEYGFSITNKPLWLIDTGPFRGKLGVRMLKTKEPHNFRFEVDDFRNITALLHERPDTQSVERITALDEFVIYSYHKEFANPYGKSDYRRAYRWWNSKKYVGRMWDIWLERYAGGFLDITYGAGKQQAAEHTQLQQFAKDLSTPRTGVMHSDNYQIAIQEPAGRGQEAYKEAIAERNIYMARAVLIPDLLGFSQRPGGAFALGKKHFDVFMQILDELGEDIEETIIFEQIIKPQIDMNFPPGRSYPRFRFDPMTDDQKVFFITNIIAAIEKGVVTPDLEIENRLRQMLGLPDKEEEEEPIEPQQEPEGGDDDDDDDDEIQLPAGDTTKNLPDEIKEAMGMQSPAPGIARALRKPTMFERKVDVKGLAAAMNALEPQFVELWSEHWRTARNKMIDTIKRKQIVENGDVAAVKMLALPRRQGMQKTLARHMLGAFYMGALAAQSEVRSAGKLAEAFSVDRLASLPLGEIAEAFEARGLAVTPAMRAAARALREESFFITGAESEKVLAQAKQIIFKGLRRGDVNWTAAQLNKLFDGYLEQGVITEKALGEAHRAATIARTNFTSAINEGRRLKFEDPDVADFIVAYQWSAILDGTTTDYCRRMDGRVFRKDELKAQGFPPAHHNCRSFVVPVTQGERFEFADIPSGAKRGSGFDYPVRGEELETVAVYTSGDN